MSAQNIFGEPIESQGNSPATLGQTQSLYRKYRPQTFQSDDLVGQDAIIRTLRNSISLDRVAHAYLFTGPRGTGKTSTARLLAKAVNCLDPDPRNRPCNRCEACLAANRGSTIDIIEIDAASNRGIDDIRELRERVKFAPTFLRTKFYIVDEAHQITGAAANAFLKTLEEPPLHTKFVLATTDPEQLLPTIVSRCQRFDFRRITPETISQRLKNVATLESIAIDDDAIDVVSRNASGSLRDALGMLDQLAAFVGQANENTQTPISAGDVDRLLGIAENELIEHLIRAIADRDAGKGLALLNQAVNDGEDPRRLNSQLTNYFRLTMYSIASKTIGEDDLANRFSLGESARLARMFSETDFKVRRSAIPHLPLEITFVEAVLRSEAPAGDPQLTAPISSNSVPALRQVSPSREDANALEHTMSSVPTTREEAPKPEETKPVPAAPIATGAAVTVDVLHELWPKIRMDVKARDRRIEALLSSCDPASVSADTITLVTNYKFHSERLNDDASKVIIEGVVGRLLGQTFNITTEIRGQVQNSHQVLEPRSPGLTSSGVAPGPSQDPSDDERRVTAAKNIFGAEEISS